VKLALVIVDGHAEGEVLDLDDACTDGYCGGCDHCISRQVSHYGAEVVDFYGPVERPQLRTVCTEAT
jgi:hypothetical protein